LSRKTSSCVTRSPPSPLTFGQLMSARMTVICCTRRRRLVVLERQRQYLSRCQGNPLRRLLHPGALPPHRPSSAPETDESPVLPRRRSSDSASLPSLPASVSIRPLAPSTTPS
jgi:hypothetical protein